MNDQASSLLTQAVMLRERGGAKPDNIVTLPLAAAEAPAPAAAPRPPGRDWLSAVELVKEASEAIRLAEARNVELQAGLNQVLAEASAEIKELKETLRATTVELAQTRDWASDVEQRAVEAERRADEAERRAEEAEAWLCRLHDAIVKEFGPAVRLASAPEPQAKSRSAEANG
jgi:hypothetical protein